MAQARKTNRGGCPRCEKTIPFGRAMFRRGQTFGCPHCGGTLLVPKTATRLAITGFVLLSFTLPRVPFALAAVLLGGGIVLEWLLAKVLLVEEPMTPA